MLTAPLSTRRHRLPRALVDAPCTHQKLFTRRSLPWQRLFVGFVVGPWRDTSLCVHLWRLSEEANCILSILLGPVGQTLD